MGDDDGGLRQRLLSLVDQSAPHVTADELFARASRDGLSHHPAAPRPERAGSRRRLLSIGWAVVTGALVVGVIAFATATHGGAPRAQAPHSHRVTPASRCTRSHPSLAGVQFLSPDVGVGISFISIECKHANTASDWRESVTTDGGKTWSRRGEATPGADTEQVEPSLVAAASADNVWVSRSNQRLLWHSTDGGATWVVQSAPGPVSGLAIKEGNVFALSCEEAGSECAPVLEREPVSGGAWDRLRLPHVESRSAPQLLVISPSAILVLAELVGRGPGELLVTVNGGTTWTVEPTPLGPSKVCTQDIGVTAVSATTWWLLCLGQSAAGSSTGALFHTFDGGNVWSTVHAQSNLAAPNHNLPLGDPEGFGAGFADTLWLTNQAGLEESSDGGLHWSGGGVNTFGLQASFDVLSAHRVWMLVPGAGLWVTTDGSKWYDLASKFDG